MQIDAPILRIAAFFALSTAASLAQPQAYVEPLTNANVELMVHRGIPLATIVQAIKKAPEVDFLIDNYETLRLTEAGASDSVSDQIVQAMRQRMYPAMAPSIAVTARSVVPAPVSVASTGEPRACIGVVSALEIAHTRKMADRIPAQMYALAVSSSATLVSSRQQASLNPVLKRAIYDAFEPNSVYADMLAIFADRCDQEKLDSFQSLARTNTFKAMDRLKMEALRPDFAAGLEAFASTSGQIKPSSARVALLQRIVQATGATEMSVSMSEAADRAARGLSGGAEGSSASASDIPNFRQTMAQQVLLMNMYIYRTVKEEDLASYTEFLEQTPVRWFNQTYLASVREIIEGRLPLAISEIKSEIESSKAARR